MFSKPEPFAQPDSSGILSPSRAMAQAGEKVANVTWHFKCKLFDVTLPQQCEEYENLINRVRNGDKTIEWGGEQGSFGKESNYLIFAKWLEAKIDKSKTSTGEKA